MILINAYWALGTLIFEVQGSSPVGVFGNSDHDSPQWCEGLLTYLVVGSYFPLLETIYEQ